MSIPCNTLPAEIWLLIFNHVESVKQLAVCRAVCKAWNPLAERAMFGQALYFNDVHQLTVFYHHLVKKPFLGQCINSLQIEDSIDMDTLPCQRNFFRLAFTPNIRSLQGTVSDESHQIMIDIAQGSTEKFKKLAHVSPRLSFDKAIHREFVLCFCKSLKSLGFDILDHKQFTLMQDLVSRLDEFECLTQLTILLGEVRHSLTIIDEIIKKCNHLLELDIEVYDFRMVWIEPEDLNQWMMQHVSRCVNVCELRISVVKNPQIAEYLLYKYPNTNRVYFQFDEFTEDQREALKRCMHVMTNVDTVTVQALVKSKPGLLQDITIGLKSENSTFTFSESSFGSTINVTKYKSIGRTDFTIRIREDEPASVIEKIMSLGGDEAHDLV